MLSGSVCLAVLLLLLHKDLFSCHCFLLWLCLAVVILCSCSLSLSPSLPPSLPPSSLPSFCFILLFVSGAFVKNSVRVYVICVFANPGQVWVKLDVFLCMGTFGCIQILVSVELEMNVEFLFLSVSICSYLLCSLPAFLFCFVFLVPLLFHVSLLRVYWHARMRTSGWALAGAYGQRKG